MILSLPEFFFFFGKNRLFCFMQFHESYIKDLHPGSYIHIYTHKVLWMVVFVYLQFAQIYQRGQSYTTELIKVSNVIRYNFALRGFWI